MNIKIKRALVTFVLLVVAGSVNGVLNILLGGSPTSSFVTGMILGGVLGWHSAPWVFGWRDTIFGCKWRLGR